MSTMNRTIKKCENEQMGAAHTQHEWNASEAKTETLAILVWFIQTYRLDLQISIFWSYETHALMHCSGRIKLINLLAKSSITPTE